jgi:FAD/FMN-containing dehydrogenase
MVLIERVGSAAGRVDPDGTAFPHRAAPYNLLVISAWDDPAADAANVGWARELWAAIQPFTAGGVYVNYLSDARQEGEDRVRAAYGAHYDRLVALKRTYDPTNLFRFNQNLAPAV